MRKFIATLCTVTLVLAAASLAVAQDDASIRAIFAAAPKTATSVAGVSVFQAPPKGFNALTASWQELARYGLPQRPNQQTDPQRYARWVRAMTVLPSASHPTDLKALPYHSSPAKLITPQTGIAAPQAVSNVPGLANSGNWSGVVNTNKLTKWNKVTSFNVIESDFVVPSAYTPFNACSNGITGPFLMSAWNGIDGFNSGDVVQGGIMTYSDCGGAADNEYIAWVEWYPSYPELEIDAPVNPGDTVFVETLASPGTDTQTVFVEDVSQPWSGSFSLTYITGPGVIGNSEEQVVERPCCNGNDFYALNNYDYEYFAGALGTDVHGTEFTVGEQTVATFLVDMYNDGGTQIISEPIEQGSTGNAGKLMLWMSDEGCAYSGGCAP